MRLKKHKDGYHMWLSAKDTYDWAHKTRAYWPCSQLSDKRCFVAVDANGLYDFTIDGKIADIDDTELSACIGDHLPDDLQQFWPCWR